MNLSEIYANLSTAGDGATTASSVLDVQHWFCSLADFDPRSGEPLPRAMSRVLVEIAEGRASRRGPAKDRLWRICKHCGMALQALYRSPNEEPFRVRESLHIRAVRELDVQSFMKLSMRPGLNIRQKLSGNPHLDAVRHTMTLDIPENRLLKACSEELERWLDAKNNAVGLLPDESELLDNIRSWLHGDVAASISPWKNLPPNNTLLSHREYRRVWDAWRQLGRIDDETAEDVCRIDKIKEDIRFWEGLANLKQIDVVYLAEVPLLFDLSALSIVPFGEKSGGIPFVFVESSNQESLNGQILSLGTKLPTVTGCEVLPTALVDRTTEPVCIDFVSALPMYSTDVESVRVLQHFLAWQRWSSQSGNQIVDVGCFEADGAWKKTGVQTVTPIEAFIQVGHDKEVLDVAFRAMVDFLKATYFGGETFIWLTPDFLDEFTLGLPRRAINSSFAAAEPLPRSIAAVIAQVQYDSITPGDSILVVDQLGGVVFATKIVASHDDELAAAVPETHGIRWTRHPSIVLKDERSSQGLVPEVPSVDENGTWTFVYPQNPTIPSEMLDKAIEMLGCCSKYVFATSPQFPLVCGGLRAFSLQRKAGDLAIWRDQLPALSIGNVIVDGMYGDFALVDPTSKSVKPVRGQTVKIPVPNIFNLPKRKTAFPLHQGEGRQTLDYVAEIDFPPQRSSIACRLDLRYTYGADEPYSLDFIPCTESRSLPHRIHVRWKSANQKSFLVPSLCSSPSFPPAKSWKELQSFSGNSHRSRNDLVNRVISVLSRKREAGVVESDVLTTARGIDYVWVRVGEKRVFCPLNEMGRILRDQMLHIGMEVRLNVVRNRNNSFDLFEGRAIAFTELDEQIILSSNLRYIRFPMLTIMQGARSLADVDFPERLRRRLQLATALFITTLGSKSVDRKLKSEVLQFFSYLHAFAPECFIKWAIGIARSPALDMHWRKLAYCLGDVSQPWQREILAILLKRFLNTSDKGVFRRILNVFGVATWRSIHFLDAIPSETISAICQKIVFSAKQWVAPASSISGGLFLEFILGLLRVNPLTGQRFAKAFNPGTSESLLLVELIDRWTYYLAQKGEELVFRVKVETQRPESLNKTPENIYALRCYLTGDDGANAISITSVDEGDDVYDDKD